MHAIRESHYEETKTLTWEEVAEATNRRAREIEAEFNLKLKYKTDPQ